MFLPRPAFQSTEALREHATKQGFSLLDGRGSVFWDVRAQKEDEGLWIKLAKVATTSSSMNMEEGVHDEALCRLKIQLFTFIYFDKDCGGR